MIEILKIRSDLDKQRAADRSAVRTGRPKSGCRKFWFSKFPQYLPAQTSKCGSAFDQNHIRHEFVPDWCPVDSCRSGCGSDTDSRIYGSSSHWRASARRGCGHLPKRRARSADRADRKPVDAFLSPT